MRCVHCVYVPDLVMPLAYVCMCMFCSRYFPCLPLEYGSTTTTVQEHRQAPRIREAEADDDASDEPPRARRTPLVTDALGAHAILCPWRHCSDAPTSCSFVLHRACRTARPVECMHRARRSPGTGVMVYELF